MRSVSAQNKRGDKQIGFFISRYASEPDTLQQYYDYLIKFQWQAKPIRFKSINLVSPRKTYIYKGLYGLQAGGSVQYTGQ